MATRRKTQKKGPHGGAREGAGQKSFFPGSHDGPMWALRLTEGTKKQIDQKIATLNRPMKEGDIRVSRNSLIEALFRLHGAGLTLADIHSVAKNI